MLKILRKHQSIYLFLFVLSFIGFISGNEYYSIQDSSTKEEISSTYNLNETLQFNNSNISKAVKDSFTIFLCGLFVLPQLYSIFYTFYYPFQLGFLFSFLRSIHYKLAIKYFCFYHLFPLISILILIRISLTISKEVVALIIYKQKKYWIRIQLLFYKYFFFAFLSLLYHFIIGIFSFNINQTLIPFL